LIRCTGLIASAPESSGTTDTKLSIPTCMVVTPSHVD
jgi:hypothetical protein